jgi:cobalt-zinc-cadmium efflux system membrane fusion protein
MKRTTTALSIVALLLAGPPLGCSGEAPPPTAGAPDHDDHDEHDDHDHNDDDHAHAEDDHAHDDESAHIEIPPAVRANLGISFVEAQMRWIEQTIRVPGRFEYLPTARREYRTAIPGRVELKVEQFERVEAGRTLYEIDSPAWRDLQQSIAEATARIASLAGRLETFAPLEAAHRAHERSLLESIEVWEQRVAQLEAVREAGGGRTEDLAGARAALASTRAELAKVQETEAELTADRTQMQADLVSARDRRAFLLESAASLVGVDASSLDETGDETGDGTGRPRWATINAIAVRATESGVVESLGLTNGSWADETAAVVTVVRPDRLRFRASGLQSDMGVLRDGLAARIVSPAPTNDRRGVPLDQAMAGTLRVGLAGDADDRTLELFVTPDTLLDWARPGVSAQLEIVTDETAEPVLAVPLAAVQRDGLRPVLFRRAPDDPDEAERIEPVLGPDDGRWVAILKGVQMGDAIVLDGAFQLMLATSGSAQKGGHFHADGTFHEDEHEGED